MLETSPAKHSYVVQFDPAGGSALAMLARLIRPGATVLEIGPATGYFTKYLTEEIGCTVDCVEVSAEMAAQASKFGRRVLVADVDEADLADQFQKGRYDYVVAADILEHLRDPWRLVRQARDVLNPAGKLLVSIPNVTHAALLAELLSGTFEYRDEGLLDRTHLRFFTRRTAVDLLRRGGYRIDMFERVLRLSEHTEFDLMLERLPRAVGDFLSHLPDATTYQFVAAATPGVMSDAETDALVATSVDSEPKFRVVLLWAGADELFSDERSHSAFARLGTERQLVRFEVSLPDGIRRLRIDPADRPGFFHIFAVRVFRKSTDSVESELVWEARSSDEIVHRCYLNNVVHLPSTLGGAFLATSRDPFFTISLAESLGRAGATLVVEVELDWPMSADYLLARDTFVSRNERLEENLAAERRQLQTFRDTLDRVRGETAVGEGKLMALGSRLQRAEMIRRLRKVDADELRRQIESQELAVTRLQSILADRDESVRSLEIAVCERDAWLAKLTSEKETLVSVRKQMASEVDSLCAKLAGAEMKAERVEAVLRQEQAALADLARLAETSLAFGVITTLRRTRDRIAPAGTRQRSLFEASSRALALLREKGVAAFARALVSKARSGWNSRHS